MKYIKLFEDFNPNSEINKFCKKYKIKNYTINENNEIDVDGDVRLQNNHLKEIPFKFGKVTGYFNVSNNDLQDLENSPNIVGEEFICSLNTDLRTLKGAPIECKGFYASECYKLSNLEYFPKIVKKGVILSNCYSLTSIKGLPNSLFSLEIDGCNRLYNFDFIPFNLRELVLPRRLKDISNKLKNDSDIIEMFGDYNITKAPVDDKSNPRLKLDNLNKLLSDNNIETIERGSFEYLWMLQDFWEIK